MVSLVLLLLTTGEKGHGVRFSIPNWIILFWIIGLKAHDCLYENEEVTEAIRRLPAHVVDERNFRMHRALQLSMTKTYLPQDQWMTYDQASSTRIMNN
jgi:hypothetical protein